MLVDLVQFTTPDGVRLDGMFQAAAKPSEVGVDAFCLVHGTGSNFYTSSLFDVLAEYLLQLGCGVLRINTRGHDGISNAVTSKGGRRLGAAYEVVDDCRHDIAGALGWLQERVGPRVGLVGHSLGAVKCLYALAQTPQPAAICVAALSPPCLSYSLFCASSQGQEFLETYTQADGHVQAGSAGALLEVKLPLPFVITASGYVEKYGPDERYNFVRFLPGIRCPTLITFGSLELENNMAFRGVPEMVQAQSHRLKATRLEVLAGADHFYGGKRQDVSALVQNWLRTSLPRVSS